MAVKRAKRDEGGAGFWKEGLEIQILGKTLDEAIALGQAGAPGKDGPHPILLDASDNGDDPHGVPVFLHEGGVNA